VSTDGAAGVVYTNEGVVENMWSAAGLSSPPGSDAVTVTNDGTITDVYFNTDRTGVASAPAGTGTADITGLTTSKMQGADATTNMPGLSFGKPTRPS
jgi:hypothetical protein